MSAVRREEKLPSIGDFPRQSLVQTCSQAGAISGALMGEMKRAIAREREAWAEQMQEQTRMKSTLVIAAAIIAAVRLARDPDMSSFRHGVVVSMHSNSENGGRVEVTDESGGRGHWRSHSQISISPFNAIFSTPLWRNSIVFRIQ